MGYSTSTDSAVDIGHVSDPDPDPSVGGILRSFAPTKTHQKE